MKANRILPILLAGDLLLALGSGLTQAQGPVRLGSAPQAAIVVNTLEDEYDSDGDCSLREAIAAANFNSPVDACPGGDSSLMDTITFAAGGTIVASWPLPYIQDAGPLTIDGGSGITISGGSAVRPLYMEQNARLTLQDLAVVDGLAANEYGGALYIGSSAAVTVNNCVFSGNRADHDGGAMFFQDAAVVTIAGSTFADNHADYGGAIEGSASIIITATSFYSNTAAFDGGALLVFFSDLTLNNCVLAHNTAGREGGGIRLPESRVIMQDCTVDSNHALYGGGATGGNSTLQIRRSHFTGNLAAAGGGIFLTAMELSVADSDFSGNVASQSGGGIAANDGSGMILRDSTFYDNTATVGGGLYNSKGSAGRSQWVSNTTFSGNTADRGGAIYNVTATLALTNTTFAGNQASQLGDALYGDPLSPGAIYLWNSIVAYGANGDDCFGAVFDGGHNIDSGTTCTFDPVNGSFLNTDPLLGPLDNHGGSTDVHPLLQGSPAVNHANPAACPPADQRGFPRRTGYCDIGAFEAQPYVLNGVAGDNQATYINTAFPVPLQIEAADEYGNPLGGVPITFEGPTSGPGLANSGTTRVTGATGQITFTAMANSLPGGPYAVYGLDPAAGLAAPSFNLTNLPYDTAAAITADDPDPSLAGQQFDVAFQVGSAYGTPTGAVGVTVAGRPETCTGNLSGGVGSCALSIATAGDYTLVATYYSDDGTFGPSSGTAPHTVNAPQPRDTVTTITADVPDPSQPSEVFTVTFQVTATSGTPTGVVVVTVSGRAETCSGPLSGGGGSCELSLPAAGDYTLVATYGGDADFNPSSDSEPHAVATPGEGYVVFLPLIEK